jgi:hypothetical protein
MPVRDREAPGSNSRPPTIFVFETRDFRRRPEPTDYSRVTDSLGTSQNEVASSVSCQPT